VTVPGTVRPKAVIDELATLVAFPTVSDRPVTALAAHLAEQAEACGMVVTRFQTSAGKCNIVARAGPQGADGLLISGHMDVVPTDGQDWSSDPFRLTERGGRLYGRGSCDMKGFIAATLAALQGLRLSSLRAPLVLAWTHDEEVGCLGSRALVDALDQTGERLPELALIGEPTDFRICRAHPGHTTLSIRCIGRAAHSSRPQLGTSAIEMAADVLRALRDLQARLAVTTPATDPLLLDALPAPYPVLNCGHIEGGSAVNIVPDSCRLRVGVRQLPGQTGAELVAVIAEAADAVAQRWSDRGGRILTTLDQEAPALLTPAGTALEDLLRPHARDAEPTAVPFATDGGNLQRAGTRSLVFGPGSIDVAHRPDEFIPAEQLIGCVGIVRRLVVDRCGARPL